MTTIYTGENVVIKGQITFGNDFPIGTILSSVQKMIQLQLEIKQTFKI